MKSEKLYLQDILEKIERIERYTTKPGKAYFLTDELLQDAVIRNFEVIGEAVRYLSEATQGRYPTVRWKDFIGFRNILIHQYDNVKMSIVWVAIEQDLPVLKKAVMELLNEEVNLAKQ
jgi:uncharacterized protein with HEPN domain